MEEQVGKRQLLQGGLEGLHQVVGQLADKSHRVGQEHRAGVGDLQGPGGGVQGVEQAVVGGNGRPGELVEQGGLARVGVAHNGHHRHLVLDAPLPLGGPHPADLLQLGLQLGNFPVDVPPVAFQLSLAGAAGADGALLALQVGPHAQQPGQQILVLGQLHLEPSLPGAGPLGEDIQDQGRPVQHLDAQLLRQHPLLGGGQGVIHHHHVRPHGPHQLLHLSRLALADEGAGIGGVLVLEHGAHAHAPRSLQQIGQLLHGGVVGVFLGGQAVGVQAHQHRPVFRLLCLVFRHTVLRAAGRSPGVSFSSVLPQSPQ